MKTFPKFYDEERKKTLTMIVSRGYNIARKKPALFMILLPPLFGKSLTIAKSYGFSFFFAQFVCKLKCVYILLNFLIIF